MVIGSEAHKELFCRRFIEGHTQYEPETLPWPDVDRVTLERLRAIPFWEEALNCEQEAGDLVRACAETQSDPLIREAINLQGNEEDRHGRLIQFLVHQYGLQVTELPIADVPEDVERAFIDFGYSECLDSFGAFGMFELARQSGYFADPLFPIFDRLLEEEARHIVFFINWVAYRQVQRGRGAKVWRAAKALRHYGEAVGRLIKVARDADDTQGDFTATKAKTFVDDLTAKTFLSTCLEANARRMSAFDHRLLRPRLIPALARVGLFGVNLVPRRNSRRDAESKAAAEKHRVEIRVE